MTFQERLKLRRWSAQVMEWKLYEFAGQVYYIPKQRKNGPEPNDKFIPVDAWTPDTDLNQLFNIFVPKMREIGWRLRLVEHPDKYEAWFITNEYIPRKEICDSNIGDAVLLAAKKLIGGVL